MITSPKAVIRDVSKGSNGPSPEPVGEIDPRSALRAQIRLFGVVQSGNK